MRRALPLALAIGLAVSVSPATPQPAVAGSDPHSLEASDDAGARAPLTADGRFIVLLKDGRSVETAKGRAGRLGVVADRTFRHAFHGYAAKLTSGQVASLRSDPDVDAVIPDEVISIAWQSAPTGIRRVNGKESLVAAIDGGGPGIDADVAIVDTGIGGRTSKAHEDLNIAGGVSCSTDNPNSWGDPNGHGTHVAGTVGAIDNGLGVVGVAPGVRLWSVRILDSGGNGLVSWYVCGLDWITAQRDPLDPNRPLFEAVNMSVARAGSDDQACGTTNRDLIHQAICRLVASGVTVVAAAGNNSFNASRLKPASYDEVITVSALADTDGRRGGLGGPLCSSWGSYDRDDTFADFSNYGRDVDLIAPGKCIFSTLPGNAYGTISGTSMAAPHVTGAVALYKASRPDATPAQVRTALRAAGTLDWNVATDPDSVHEPLLDISHLVDRGDFTVDATPGTSGGALVGAAGGVLALPLQLIRAEDFPDAVDLEVTADSPLTATATDRRLHGQDGTSSTVEVTVPGDTPSGTYVVTVTASDGARQRTSAIGITVDSLSPTAAAPSVGLRRGGRLDDGVLAVGSWSPASDPGGSVARYEVRWRVDGDLGPVTGLAASTREVTRRVRPGHVYALRVRARDLAGNWSAWVDGPEVSTVISQDTSPSLVRKGRWSRISTSWASGGKALTSTDRGAIVRRTFTGRGIAWVGTRGTRRGKAAVYIDGVRVATVDTRHPVTQHRWILYSRSWATPGSHVITIRVLGTSRRPRVEVDAFVILK